MWFFFLEFYVKSFVCFPFHQKAGAAEQTQEGEAAAAEEKPAETEGEQPAESGEPKADDAAPAAAEEAPAAQAEGAILHMDVLAQTSFSLHLLHFTASNNMSYLTF